MIWTSALASFAFAKRYGLVAGVNSQLLSFKADRDNSNLLGLLCVFNRLEVIPDVVDRGSGMSANFGSAPKTSILYDLSLFFIFEFVEVAWINDLGDVGFGAHLQGEEFLQDNVYLSKAPSFQIISIAHQGEPAPGGGLHLPVSASDFGV